MRPRVAITGIGAVCSAGLDADRFADALTAGARGFTRLDDPRLARLRATHAGLIADLEPDPRDPPAVQASDRHVRLALRALREALQRAGLGDGPLGPRGGIVFGTCSGGMLSIERHYEALVRGEQPLDEALLFAKRYYSAARVLAWAAGAAGPALTVVTACAAGAGAVAQGADLIRAGLADRVIAGGGDAFAPTTLVGFDALKATCEGICAPFSTPIGLNLGEGAAFLVLERLDLAVDRGAPLIAELLGSGLSNDAHHPTAPDPSARGQLAAMRAALADAGVTADRIDYVNAHGTGTRANDPAETRAIHKLLGARAGQVPVSSTKSMIGHCLGGAGALEASAAVLAADRGVLPPTAGFVGHREGCDLDAVGEPGRPWQGRLALSNSFGFAGNNACLVLDVAPTAEAPAADLPQPGGGPAVITGLGVVSPLGIGLEPLRGAASGVASTSRFPVPVEPYPAGLVPEIDAREVDRRLDLRGFDRCSSYAALAARSALDSAGLKPRPAAMAQVGMVLGIATGPSQGEAEHITATFESGFDLASVGAFPYVVPNEVAGNVARALMLKGHNTVLASGPGAGLAALASAAAAVELGHGATILAAAADELTERSLADGHLVGRWGPGTGVDPGEGAAVLVVERPEAADQRGATVYATVLGCALATGVDDPRAGAGPSPLRAAITGALDRAGVAANRLSRVALGGPTAAGDDELAAVRETLGSKIDTSCLVDRLGHAEAALPLFDLAHVIDTGAPGELVAAVALSPEGYASAVILRLGAD